MIDQKESLSAKFIKKGIWLYIFSFLIWPIGYIVKIILSHDLSVSEIWIIYGIISFIMLLITYHDLWLTESLNFFLPKFIVENDYKKFKSVLAYAVLAQIPTSIMIWLWLFFWADYLSINYFHDPKAAWILKIFCLFFVLMNMFSIVNTVFWASQNTKYQKWTELVRMLSILTVTLVYFLSDRWTLANYSWNWIIGLVAGIFFSYTLFYKKYYVPYLKSEKVVFDKPLFKKVFSYALWVLVAANVGTILSQIDMQLIIYKLWSESAWFYTNYQSIIWIPFLIISPIIWFLFPVISELSGKNDDEKIKTIKTMFFKYFWAIGIITSVFMFVYAKDLAIILFWIKFAKSWIILQYSIFFLVFNFLMQINFQILAWIGKIKDRVKILAVGLAFNIPLNLVLIEYIGVEWSSLAVWLSWLPIFYLSNRATKKYSWKFDYSFFLKNLFCALVLWGLMLYLENFVQMPDLRLQKLIYILIIFILYILIFVILNLKEWKMFFSELKRMKTNKS